MNRYKERPTEEIYGIIGRLSGYTPGNAIQVKRVRQELVSDDEILKVLRYLKAKNAVGMDLAETKVWLEIPGGAGNLYVRDVLRDELEGD